MYEAYVVAAEDDEGCRAAERRIARKAGMGEKYLKALVKNMPAGLVNDEDQLTLRRAANTVCGIKNDKRKYTSSELRNAVLASFRPGTVNTDICERFGVGRSALYDHRSHLVAWRKGGGTDDGESVCPACLVRLLTNVFCRRLLLRGQALRPAGAAVSR